MTLKLELTKISQYQWFKIIKAFFYVTVSFLIAAIPAYFAHNKEYLALVVPINVFLVTFKQVVTQDETAALNALPADQKATVLNTANEIAKTADPTAPTMPTPPAAPTLPGNPGGTL